MTSTLSNGPPNWAFPFDLSNTCLFSAMNGTIKRCTAGKKCSIQFPPTIPSLNFRLKMTALPKIWSLHFISQRVLSDNPYASRDENYFIPELEGNFGIIPTVTNPFCTGCSRLRLTADGKIKNCLFSNDEDDLLQALRAGKDIEELIKSNLYRKKASAGGRIDFSDEKARLDYFNNRSMINIGG